LAYSYSQTGLLLKIVILCQKKTQRVKKTLNKPNPKIKGKNNPKLTTKQINNKKLYDYIKKSKTKMTQNT
jgi:hypothetical protein